MGSIMNAQSLATRRNALAEMLIDYTLQLFSNKLYDNGLITKISETETQKDFVRDDCSDCYDHYLQYGIMGTNHLLQRKPKWKTRIQQNL